MFDRRPPDSSRDQRALDRWPRSLLSGSRSLLRGACAIIKAMMHLRLMAAFLRAELLTLAFSEAMDDDNIAVPVCT